MDSNAPRMSENIPAAAAQHLLHAMTIDVEDYYMVSAFNASLAREDWHKQASRVEDNTRRLLDIYAARDINITWFVLGMVAEKHPDLIRELHRAGHEIASHGYSHKLIYEQSQQEFHEETRRSKSILEDITGEPVRGYRAASYSITQKSLWALDSLVELGFDYDSSIFPVHHDRYGIPDAPRAIHRAAAPNGGSIIEYPLSTATFSSLRIPIAGGGYFRIYPYWLTRMLWQRAIRETRQPQVFYLHPWELDPEQPRMPDLSLLSRFRHYINLHRCEGRLERHMDSFRFGTMAEIIDAQQASELVLVQYS